MVSLLVFFEQGPEKADEFSGDGDIGFAGHFSLVDHLPIAFGQSPASLVGDMDGPYRLILAAGFEGLAGDIPMAIVSGGFIE